MTSENILSRLPYSEPFLFVDQIDQIDQNGVTGTFHFKDEAFYYLGHFKDHPVTPGVILTECMAQIGVVCLGIFLLGEQEEDKKTQMAMSSSEVDYFLPVYPGEEVKVVSTKEYFRFNKLKCQTQMFNSEGKLVCKGKIAGMVI